jgi:DMSO/TMAO reductase YedYZ heme-binding membrane subunit
MPQPLNIPQRPWLDREGWFYLKTSILSLVVFGGCYAYLRFLGIPGELNKSAADAAIILMGWSMLLSSVCYFWNSLDWAIIYRKYLGLVGFAYAIAHLVLSWQPFVNLFQAETWQRGAAWPAFAGTLAMVIFTIMAIISNSFLARKLGGLWWRRILRTGYVAIIFVWLHVVLLKSARWVTWYQEGMQTLPSLSLLVSVFMVIVIVMRVALWWSLASAARKVTTETPLPRA